MYRFDAAVSGFRWKSADRDQLKNLNPDKHLRCSLAFGGTPWKVEVERVMGIEPTLEAWEAAVLPLNYTRLLGRYYRLTKWVNGKAKISTMQIHLNGQPTTVEPGTTVMHLLEMLELTGKRVAVEINRQIVPRSQHATHCVQDSDVVEVVVAVGGG